MFTKLTDLAPAQAIIASTLLYGETETPCGERQLWLELTDQSSIELTYESAGLAPEKSFWSITMHASEDTFDTEALDITNSIALNSDASFSDAVAKIINILESMTHEDTLEDKLIRGFNGETPANEKALLWIDDPSINDLVHAYDRYIQLANDLDAYTSGWRPVCFSEFAETEYLNIWCETDPNEREECFSYLGSD